MPHYASIQRTVASGSTDTFSVPFGYLSRDYVEVYVDGTLQVVDTDYTWPDASNIQFSGGNPTAGAIIERRRNSSRDTLVDFAPGNLSSDDLDRAYTHSLHLAEEADDLAADLAVRAWLTASGAAGGTITKGDDGDLAKFDASGNIVSAGTFAELVTAADLVNGTSLSATLSSYATTSAVSAALASYVTTVSLGLTLDDYVTSVDLGTTLGSYVTTTALGTALGDYVLTTALTSTLADYVTSTSLTATLGDYVTATSLASTLTGYTLDAQIAAKTEKTSIVGADMLALLDSAASFVAKKISYTNLVAAIKSSLGLREVLTANRTYYVRADGSDSNDGLSNTSGGAWLTVQKAMDIISANLDLGAYNVTVEIADGTYTGALALKTYRTTAGFVLFRGNTTNPENVIFNVSGNAITCQSGATGYFKLRGFKVIATSIGMHFENPGMIVDIQNVDFGACGVYHIESVMYARVKFTGNITISGGAVVGFWAGRKGYIWISTITITYLNSPVFSGRHFHSGEQGFIDAYGVTFTNGGTVTGKRYQIDGLGAIFTNSGGASYLPGDVAGTTANGGVYY